MILSRKLAIVAALAATYAAWCQQPSPTTESATPPGFTLQTGVRIILTDVTVTDAKGNVVHNLPRSAFQIDDDGQPQNLRSFDEQVSASTALTDMPVTPPGVYSNEYLKHLPPVLNIIVLDTSHLALMDQMYLSYEFKNFLKHLPEGQAFALYARNGGDTVQLQNFTADHSLLAAAAAKAMPRLVPLGFDPTPGDFTLNQLAAELSQVPGRKNVIWFAGGRPMRLSANPAANGDEDLDTEYLHQLYDDLETARIAVYPIDARGLTMNGPPHSELDQLADATGGHAYYNNNGLAQIATHILASDNSFYTLTYTPSNFKADNKWHTVHVSLNIPGYNLSYRRGYFADDCNCDPQKKKQNPQLMANGQAGAVPVDHWSPPILFSASVLPNTATGPADADTYKALKVIDPPKKGTTPYTVRYNLPADAFVSHDVNGVPATSFDVAVLAFNQNGETIAVKGDQVFARFPDKDTHLPLKIAQTIDLKPGDLYLYIAVWDAGTGRLGTLKIPVTVPNPTKASLH